MNLDLIIHDSYDTPKETRRWLIDRLTLGTRLGFYWKFFQIIFRARRKALAKQYGYEPWASSSLEVFRLIEGVGGKFHINGIENLKKCNPPVVFISNHMSTLETMVFPFLIAPHMKATFVVKDSLVSHPIFGPIMRSRKPIVVSRSNTRQDLIHVIEEGQKLLNEGISVVIFPQSTRKAEFIPEEFNSLGCKLAGKAGVQVVPIAIKTDFWANGKKIRDLGPIQRKEPIFIKFGEPMDIQGNGRDQHHQIVEYIQNNLRKWTVS